MNKHGAKIEAAFLIFEIILGWFDSWSDVYYFFSYDVDRAVIGYAQAGFLAAPQVLLFLIWAIMLAKMEIDNLPETKFQQKQKENIEFCDSFCRFIWLKLQSYYYYSKDVAYQTIFTTPSALLITLLNILKILPFFIVGYTYFLKKIIITPQLVVSMKPELTAFFRQKAYKRQQQKNKKVKGKKIHPSLKNQLQQMSITKDHQLIMTEQDEVDVNTSLKRESIFSQAESLSSNSNTKKSSHNQNTSLDVIYDVNLIPKFLRFIEDDTMRQIIWMGDILSGLFQSLPMSILQYINNDLLDYWVADGFTGQFAWFCFITSTFTVVLSTQKLLSTLFNDDISLYYGLLTYISEKPLSELEQQFKVPPKLEIDNISHLQKFQNMKQDSIKNTPYIKMDFQNQNHYNQLIIQNVLFNRNVLRFQNIKHLNINISGNNFDHQIIEQILYEFISNKNLNELEVDLQENEILESTWTSILIMTHCMKQLEHLDIKTNDHLIWRPKRGQETQYILDKLTFYSKHGSFQNIILNLSGRGFNQEVLVDLIEVLKSFQKLNYMGVNLKQSFITQDSLIYDIVPSRTVQWISAYDNLTFCYIETDNFTEFGTSITKFSFDSQIFTNEGGVINTCVLDQDIKNFRQSLFLISFINCCLNAETPPKFSLSMTRTNLVELNTKVWDQFVRRDPICINRLQNLQLDYNMIEAEDLQVELLSQELKQSKLLFLGIRLSNTVMNIECCKLLSEGIVQSSIQTLVLILDQTKLREPMFNILADSIERSKKQQIFFSAKSNKLSNNISDNISSTISNCNSEQLYINLENNNITDEGLINICNSLIKTNTQQCRVALGGNNIYDETRLQIKQKLEKSKKYKNQEIDITFRDNLKHHKKKNENNNNKKK